MRRLMLVVHLFGGPIAVKVGSMRTQIVVQGVHFFNSLYFLYHQGWLCVDTNCCARFFFFAVLVLCVSGWVGLCVGVTTR